MKHILTICLLIQLSAEVCAEKLQFWNKLPDIDVYYAVGDRDQDPNTARFNWLPAFDPKKVDASRTPEIEVDNSRFPWLVVVQVVNGAPGTAGMLYEFKTAEGKPIKAGKKLYVSLMQGKISPEFTKQTYIYNNIDDVDIKYIAGKGSKPISLNQMQLNRINQDLDEIRAMTAEVKRMLEKIKQLQERVSKIKDKTEKQKIVDEIRLNTEAVTKKNDALQKRHAEVQDKSLSVLEETRNKFK